jgi:phospho-N-acetylmuramoyl-pentapeptide-transferase
MLWAAWGVGQVLGHWFSIKWFRAQSLNQRIYEDSPASHQEKVGTPTMGGVVLFGGFFIGAVLLGEWTFSTFWVVATSACFWVIGFVDDAISLKKKSNKGLSARVKFMAQLGVSLVMMVLYHLFIMPVGFLLGAWYVFILIGTSNATNLTDGLDGLLGTMMLISLYGMSMLGSLWLPAEVQLIHIMMASIVFFLVFNWHPAKIFMGDVGSLMLGGFLASLAIVSGKWSMLIGFGAIYAIETLSVIAQVAWFKLHKTRIFLMSPLHHHFELMGMGNGAVLLTFGLLQLVFVWLQLQ